MKSWKEDNLINFKESNENSFEYEVFINGGYIRVVKNDEDGNYKYTNKKYITNREANTIDKCIKQDSDVYENRGLANYVDNKYDPYIESILYNRIKEGEIKESRASSSYSFKPIVCFKVKGTLPENISLEEFKDYIKDFVEGQCSDGWGEGFEQRPLPVKPRKDHFGFDIPVRQYKYFSPWSPESEVWLRERY